MQRFKHLLVPLNLTDTDVGVLTWAGKVAQMAATETVHFVHATEVAELPAEAKAKYPWLATPLKEVLQKKLEETVQAHWPDGRGAALSFDVVQERSPVLAILQLALDYDTDLVVVSCDEMGADLAVRLARKAPCSVMSIPQDAPTKLEKILVPTDFSEHAEAALDVAVAFAEAEGIAGIDSLHVCSLGKFSHRVTLPQSELESITLELADEQHTAYAQRMDTRGLDLQRHEVVHHYIPTAVSQHVSAHGIDLIVAGCRGKNSLTAMLLGSNVEELLKNAPVPVIAAKIKGTGRKLLEELLHG